jgi:putative peptide zinc metalloprotease protein
MIESKPSANDQGPAPQGSPSSGQDQLTVQTLPEYPGLSPTIRLVGEMQGTGFQDQQWLIQRGDRFILVSELLYRVVEQIDGTRTLDEIAAAVTDATEWMVTGENVRRIITSKLMPLGLISTAENESASSSIDRRLAHPRSALSVKMRVRVVGSRIIDPITGVLQYLYTPVILVPLLIAIAAAQGWLYLVHGIGRSFQDTLFTPGLLLLVLAIMLASGVFHEFGHASALRYGGGRVRTMGIGIYLIYPAFFTDVTDSYRLGRWARVRTDLGGFYFSLLFALGLVGLYVTTGQSYLLVVALLIDLDILYQCIPFVRLDGYWALTDLVGVPDMLSQMGPFMRSLRPGRSLPGTRLPPLKRWVKAIFIAYMVAAVPILAWFGFLTVTRAPAFLITIGSALRRQIADVYMAQTNQDPATMALAVAQACLLSVMILGMLGILFSLCGQFLGLVWKWSKSTPARRVAGATVSLGVLGLMVLYWVPELPLSTPAPPSGVQVFHITERNHVTAHVVYATNPPVAGNHSPVWQNCGFYYTPVGNEHAVHSMEHGAVWITYQPGLPTVQIAALRLIAHQHQDVLVSAYPGLPAPVVASAWDRQMRLDSAFDPSIMQFVRAFADGPQAPEQGGSCAGGLGSPQ